MKKIKSLFSTICISVIMMLLLTSCGKNKPENIITKTTNIDISDGEVVTYTNTHGGMGDGITSIIMSFEDDTVLDQISENKVWKAFPLDDTTQVIVYGNIDRYYTRPNGHPAEFTICEAYGISEKKATEYVQSDQVTQRGPYLNDNNKPLVPEIENGYYYFIDRQKDQSINILDRYSMNFTLLIYDQDNRNLYYFKYDS